MAKFPLETIRHSASHLMAAAVLELYPDVKFDIGPSTEDGFYYDFDFGTVRLTPEELVKIEEKMTELAAKKLPFTRFELTREEAVKLLTEKKQNFKLERLADIPEGEAISFYQLGNFVDLCRGPHVDNTGDIGAFKLTSIAGSYYRGKESNPMLTRIYGTAFSDKKELREYLQKIEEAQKRDHRKIGRELDLFSVSETVGPGLVLWHPRGALIRNLIETFWRGEHMANGYDLPLFFGNWYAIDALRRAPGGGTELAFSLGPGRYELPGATRLTLQEAATGTLRTESGRAEVEVPEGWSLIRAEGATRVLRHTRHFFDSQFVRYLNGLVHLDLGMSLETKQPVTRVLAQGLLPTLSLSVPILFFGAMLGVVLGLLCAASQGGLLDRGVLAFSTLLMSVNYVVWILLGQFLLGFKWPVFPIWGYESAYYLVLPVLIGVVSMLGADVRFYRAAILDEVYRPYVRTAVSKGVGRGRVLFVHVLRNSLIPIVTYVSLSIPYLFTGSLLLESFFGIPGLGSVSINAINSADMSVVRAVVIFGALIYQVVNLLTDIAYGWLDPRVRFAQ